MRLIRWSNTPIPEGHLLPLIAGTALDAFLPRPLFKSPRLNHILGWPLLLPGALLAAWAVVTTRDVDIDRPGRLIVSGPYRYSRNPMYVAWTLIYLGIALRRNSRWPLVFLPAVLGFTHFFVIRREEEQLEKVFGEEYRQYRGSVRRYL